MKRALRWGAQQKSALFFLSTGILLHFLTAWLPAQNYLPPSNGQSLPGQDPNSAAPVSKVQNQGPIAPPPVYIDGKPADKLTPEEQRTFLQEKVRSISQEDGEVEIIHVAPGYPVTLRFTEPITDITVGDKKLIGVTRHGKLLLFTALATTGDTPIQVFFGGNKLRLYHVFATDSFVNGDSAITVQPFASGGAQTKGYQSNASRRDLREFIHIIANYDGLKQEGSLDTRNISRDDIFKENPATGFTVFYLYRIHGAAAFTFAYRNISRNRVRFDESRVRVAIGNSLFIPDYVSFHDVELDPGAITTGLVILFNPTFDLHQPLELIWK